MGLALVSAARGCTRERCALGRLVLAAWSGVLGLGLGVEIRLVEALQA